MADESDDDDEGEDPRLVADRDLLVRLKAALPALREARDGFPMRRDAVYRFWHQSFKVFGLQSHTQKIADTLQAVDPDRPLNPWFMQIVADGTGHEFKGRETNKNWLAATRPIVEAWFHASHMLREAIECAETMTEAGPSLEFNWATVLCLYQQR
jgi:hypothetical protein